MNRLLITALLSVLFISPACEEGPVPPDPDPGFSDGFTPAVNIGDSKLPYVVIDTEGTGIVNEPKVPANLSIYLEGEKVQTQTIVIEFRGSTSFRISDKKSYGIESWDEAGNDIDVSFFGMPEEEDWVLLGHVVNEQGGYIFDRTMMYHYIGYTWSRSIGRYASRTQFVEMELNGVYQGVYVFAEKLKRDGDRIDVPKLEPMDTDITGGYILKIDKTSGGDQTLGQPLEYYLSNWDDDARYTDQNSFRSSFDINGDSITFEPYDGPYHSNQFLETYFLYEYPKAENITPEQKEYISGYIHDFEKALLTDDFSTSERTYTDYIELNSFVEYLLLTELTRNIDAYRLSTYLQKDRGSKLAMGPIWDLNIGYGTGDRVPWDGWVYEYNTYVNQDAWMVPFWWPRLMEDPQFKALVKSRWQELRAGPLSNTNLLNSIEETANLLKDNGAIGRNYAIWDAGLDVDYDNSITGLREYIEFRTNWMDMQIASF
ncbi:MAG: CotH kinase family protein [Bacteroidota bacterium]